MNEWRFLRVYMKSYKSLSTLADTLYNKCPAQMTCPTWPGIQRVELYFIKNQLFLESWQSLAMHHVVSPRPYKEPASFSPFESHLASRLRQRCGNKTVNEGATTCHQSGSVLDTTAEPIWLKFPMYIIENRDS